jgi:WD40 repeat protein
MVQADSPGLPCFLIKIQSSVLSYSADSRYVATGSRDKTVRIWDAPNGQSIGKPLQHDTDVNSISFDPATSNRLVTTFDTSARIWDRSTEQHQDLKHPGTVTSAQFTSTGDAVLTTCQVAVWVSERLSHRDSVKAIAFVHDGKLLVTASKDGSVRIWDLNAPTTKDDRLRVAALARQLMPVQLTKTGLLESSNAVTVSALATEFSPPDGSAASQLADWLDHNPQARKLSPFSANSVLSYTENLISENNENALAEAAVLASGDWKLEQKVLATYRRIAR